MGSQLQLSKLDWAFVALPVEYPAMDGSHRHYLGDLVAKYYGEENPRDPLFY